MEIVPFSVPVASHTRPSTETGAKARALTPVLKRGSAPVDAMQYPVLTATPSIGKTVSDGAGADGDALTSADASVQSRTAPSRDPVAKNEPSTRESPSGSGAAAS
jgi:hypothetical protein